MLCDHPFSQKNKATKRAVDVEFGDEGARMGGQNLKEGW